MITLDHNSMMTNASSVKNVEDAVKNVWLDVLGVNQFFYRETFCYLGGNKLLFKFLEREIKNQFGCDIQTLSHLDGNFTCYDLISCVMKSLKITNRDSVIQLRSGDGDLVWIFVHPIGGTLFPFDNLLASFVPQGMVLGIQDPFLQFKYISFSSLEEQAEYYVTQIEPFLIGKKVILVGYSSGGSIASAMMQFMKKYCELKHILMFDSWVSMPFTLAFRDTFKAIISRQLDIIKPEKYFDASQMSEWLQTIWNRMQLLFTYNPTYIKCPSTVFMPLESVAEYQVDPEAYLQWQEYFSEVNYVTVNGNHENMLEMKDLANIVSCFNDVQREYL